AILYRHLRVPRTGFGDQVALYQRLPDRAHRVRLKLELEVDVGEAAAAAVRVHDIVLEHVAGDSIAVVELETPCGTGVAENRVVKDAVVLRRLRVAVRLRNDAFVAVLKNEVAAHDVPSAFGLHARIGGVIGRGARVHHGVALEEVARAHQGQI